MRRGAHVPARRAAPRSAPRPSSRARAGVVDHPQNAVALVHLVREVRRASAPRCTASASRTRPPSASNARNTVRVVVGEVALLDADVGGHLRLEPVCREAGPCRGARTPSGRGWSSPSRSPRRTRCTRARRPRREVVLHLLLRGEREELFAALQSAGNERVAHAVVPEDDEAVLLVRRAEGLSRTAAIRGRTGTGRERTTIWADSDARSEDEERRDEDATTGRERAARRARSAPRRTRRSPRIVELRAAHDGHVVVVLGVRAHRNRPRVRPRAFRKRVHGASPSAVLENRASSGPQLRSGLLCDSTDKTITRQRVVASAPHRTLRRFRVPEAATMHSAMAPCAPSDVEGRLERPAARSAGGPPFHLRPESAADRRIARLGAAPRWCPARRRSS